MFVDNVVKNVLVGLEMVVVVLKLVLNVVNIMYEMV